MAANETPCEMSEARLNGIRSNPGWLTLLVHGELPLFLARVGGWVGWGVCERERERGPWGKGLLKRVYQCAPT